MPQLGTDGSPIGKQGTRVADEERVAKKHIYIGVGGEVMSDLGQRPFQVLFIAIEPADDISSGPGKAAINGIVHAGVAFDVKMGLGVFEHPFVEFRPRLRVLDDVLDFDALLVCHRSSAEFQPRQLFIAGCDDRDFERMIGRLAMYADGAGTGGAPRSLQPPGL